VTTFEVTITMIVVAEDGDAAQAIGVGAAEHLNDTFNDNGSIDPLMMVETLPIDRAGSH
jgi:hypothetical protein